MKVVQPVLWGALLIGPATAGETASSAADSAVVRADAKTVLASCSPWRWHTIWSKPMVSVEALQAAGKEGREPIPLKPKTAFYRLHNSFEKEELEPLPSGWKEPAFDDAGWARSVLPVTDPQFFYARLLAARARFVVADPKNVQGLQLTLNYRGGAVVYLNGREVARLDLPSGGITATTPGRRYPDEAWLDAAGKALPGPEHAKDEAATRIAQRDRRSGPIELSAAALRQGVNILAIELHRSDLHPVALTWWATDEFAYGAFRGWGPIGLNDVRLTATGEGITPNLDRPAGPQVWNCAPFDTVTAFDYGDAGLALRTVTVPAARNGVFSGRIVVSSDRTLTALKVTPSDLAQTGGSGKIPASAIRVRYAEPAVAGKSWTPPHRFDALWDAIPAEIRVLKAVPPRDAAELAHRRPAAVAPIWLTIHIPKDAPPGKYEGALQVVAEGLEPTTVPLRVDVSAWCVPDPKNFRVHNFAYLSEDALAKHYGVPPWSDRHWMLMGKSLALMAEINSRQAIVNLAVNFYGGNKGAIDCSNEQSLVRWIKQPDGSYKYDFTLFDKYLDVVAKTIGRPTLLRVNCWPELTNKVYQRNEVNYDLAKLNVRGQMPVTLLDAATGRLDLLEQPTPGTEESLAFWKPVLNEVRKRVEARGWWDVTAVGHNSYAAGPHPLVVSVCRKIWPDGVWSYTAHNGTLGMKFPTEDKALTMPVRHADALWTMGRLAPDRGYRALLQPRPHFWCYTFRTDFRAWTPLTMPRTIPEEEIMRGHDGVSDFGADLFPVKSEGGQGYYCVGNGRGTGGPNDSTQALLAPGPEGPIGTERFEMLREGVELAEAILFVQRALEDQQLGGDLEQRANQLLDERVDLLLREVARRRWSPCDRFERDAKLLALAGEVAAAVEAR